MGIDDVFFLILGIFFIVLGGLAINHYMGKPEEGGVLISGFPLLFGILCIICVITGHSGLIGILLLIIITILYTYFKSKYPEVMKNQELKGFQRAHKKFLSSVILRTAAAFCVILILFILIRALFY
jgi:hypothetical protein